MTDHLLSLSTLHAAAPGVLDVIFGPDGDFEGAPPWRPFVWGHLPMEFARQARHIQIARAAVVHAGEAQWLEPLSIHGPRIVNAALDLRIPSVAARLAGLCALVLGISGETPAVLCWSLDPTGRGRWMLTRVGDRRHGPAVAAWDGFGQPIRCYADTAAPLPPPISVPHGATPTTFLAALTLTLAPRIAALRSTP